MKIEKTKYNCNFYNNCNWVDEKICFDTIEEANDHFLKNTTDNRDHITEQKIYCDGFIKEDQI